LRSHAVTPPRDTFPFFCVQWCVNDKIIIAGGGGTKGSGVKSGILITRVVEDRNARKPYDRLFFRADCGG